MRKDICVPQARIVRGSLALLNPLFAANIQESQETGAALR
jgi:hypothetical protein